MKRIFSYILYFSVFVYLIIVITFVTKEFGGSMCTEVVLKGGDGEEFTEGDAVLGNLSEKLKKLERRKLSSIDKDSIESEILSYAPVKSVEVYTDIRGKLYIDIEERHPLFCVRGPVKKFYVDREGVVMNKIFGSTERLHVATGDITEEYAVEKLRDFVLWLEKDDFWNSFVEQIVIEGNKDAVLIPKLGDFKIRLGKLGGGNYEERFEKLYLLLKNGFYPKGWDAYKEVNLKYENLIYCVKK